MSPGEETPGAWPGPERRSRTRERTWRRAVCSRPGVDDVFSDGMVVDISPNGLGIRTAVPLAEGDPIEIEVFPRGESGRSNIILVRGRVVRVARDGGEYTMGVQLGRSGATPSADPAAVIDFPSQARAMIARLPGQLRNREAGAPSPLAFAEHQAGETETPVTFRKGRRWRRARGMLLLLLLLLLVGTGWWFMHSGLVTISERGVPSYGLATRSVGENDPTPPALETTEPKLTEQRARHHARADRRGALRLAEAQDMLLTGHTASAHGAFRDLAQDTSHDALSRFVARLGMAWAATLLDRKNDALEAINAALAQSKQVQGGAIPEPWVGVAKSMEADLSTGDPPWTALGFLVDSLVLGELRARTEDETHDTGDSAIRIEVNTSEYLLTVHRGDLVLGQFPVGLGKQGATPLGDFALVSKIRDPAWYNPVSYTHLRAHET